MPATCVSGIVDEGEAEAAAVALPAPIRHLRHRSTTLRARGGFFEQLEPELHRIDAALERDLVHEGFGRELVGGEADAAQRRGAHAGVAIELLDQLVRDVVAVQLGAAHQDAVASCRAARSAPDRRRRARGRRRRDGARRRACRRHRSPARR